jgi:hypothetical protein
MNKSLELEKELLDELNVRGILYDWFSKKHPNSKIIINFMDWATSYGKYKQKVDIDYEVIIDDTKYYSISVKTRDNDFNFIDIPIEIFSSYKYDNNSSMAIAKPGSMLKSKANLFFYINHKKHVIIENHNLSNFIHQLTLYNSDNLINKNLLDIQYKKSKSNCQISEKEYILRYPVNDKFENIPVKFMKSENKMGNNAWTTISICVKLETLNKLQIRTIN